MFRTKPTTYHPEEFIASRICSGYYYRNETKTNFPSLKHSPITTPPSRTSFAYPTSFTTHSSSPSQHLSNLATHHNFVSQTSSPCAFSLYWPPSLLPSSALLQVNTFFCLSRKNYVNILYEMHTTTSLSHGYC